MAINQPELERLMVIEHTLMTAEGGYLKNPTDSDVSIFVFMDLCFLSNCLPELHALY